MIKKPLIVIGQNYSWRTGIVISIQKCVNITNKCKLGKFINDSVRCQSLGLWPAKRQFQLSKSVTFCEILIWMYDLSIPPVTNVRTSCKIKVVPMLYFLSNVHRLFFCYVCAKNVHKFWTSSHLGWSVDNKTHSALHCTALHYTE
jgi:hypothetical protein